MMIKRLFLFATRDSAMLLNPLQPAFALAVRLWVAWQFLKSGWLKVTSWDTTLFLFENEYRVPLLPSDLAAVAGTAGELVFPVLLALGLFGRLSAAGLFAVNVMAVVSYAHVLLSPGFEAALAQHYLWGFMLLALFVYGPGTLSLDYWLTARADMRAGGRALPPRGAIAI
jgi:putative oxidoreductase